MEVRCFRNDLISQCLKVYITQNKTILSKTAEHSTMQSKIATRKKSYSKTYYKHKCNRTLSFTYCKRVKYINNV